MFQLYFIIYTLIGTTVMAKQTPTPPMVDPGLFVISGVITCGSGSGYCLLGTDCSLDQDFIEDSTGHCLGLKGAFTPSAHFVCCRDSRHENEIESEIDDVLNDGNYTLGNEVTDSNEELTTNSSVMNSTREIINENVGKSLTTIDKDTNEINKITTTEQIDQNTSTDQDMMTTSETPQEITTSGLEKISESKVDPLHCSQNNCTTSIKFYNEDLQICLGMLIGPGWVFTSASCALRVFRVGMVNVVASPIDDPESQAAVKTIIVNENYRPSVSNILLPESNNVGLIRLNETFSEKCAPCIPDKNDAFAGEMCYTFVNATVNSAKIGPIDVTNCEAELETMQGEEAKEEFFTLACNPPTQSRYLGGEIDSGKALICQGYLAGVETSSGIGLTVFTKVSSYIDWIHQNMKPHTRQHFKRTDK